MKASHRVGKLNYGYSNRVVKFHFIQEDDSRNDEIPLVAAYGTLMEPTLECEIITYMKVEN